MSEKQSKGSVEAVTVDASPDGSLMTLRHADDALLAQIGYKSEFKREFSVSQWRPPQHPMHTNAISVAG